jgi:ribosomal protein S21
MAIHAHRKGNESGDSLLQRWKRQVQNSELMKTLRARSIHTKKPSQRLTRMRALKREAYRAKNSKNQFYSNM